MPVSANMNYNGHCLNRKKLALLQLTKMLINSGKIKDPPIRTGKTHQIKRLVHAYPHEQVLKGHNFTQLNLDCNNVLNLRGRHFVCDNTLQEHLQEARPCK